MPHDRFQSAIQLKQMMADFEQIAPDLHRQLCRAATRNPSPWLEYEDLEPDLFEALRSNSEENIRVKVAYQLLFFGPSRFWTIDALLEARKDQSPKVRDVVELCLLSLCREGQSWAAAILHAAMANDSPEIRREAIEAWRRMGLDLASGAVPDLIRALNDPESEDQMDDPESEDQMDDLESEVQMEAISTLAWLGPEAEAAVPRLLEIMQSEREKPMIEASVLALVKIDPQHDHTLDYLKEIQGVNTQEVLLKLLRGVGEKARSLRQALQKEWGEGRGLQLSHPNGPGELDCLWFGGRSFHIQHTPFKLLRYLWGVTESASIREIATSVWGRADYSSKEFESVLKTTLKRVSAVLVDACVPWSYHKRTDGTTKEGYIVKQ